MNKAQLKELVKNIMTEESEYQVFFKKALEKAGKSIPSMSDEEKKAFFDKIDATWDGKGEKNEGNAFGAAVTAAKKAGEDEFEVGGETYKVEEKLVGGQKKLDVDGDGEIEASDLADLRAGKKADESMELPKATIPSAVKSKLDMAIDKIKDSDLTYNQKIQVVGKVMDSLGIDKAEFNKMASKLKGTMESTTISESIGLKKNLKEADTVKNPKTGKDIKVKTALAYGKSHPAYKAASAAAAGGDQIKNTGTKPPLKTPPPPAPKAAGTKPPVIAPSVKTAAGSKPKLNTPSAPKVAGTKPPVITPSAKAPAVKPQLNTPSAPKVAGTKPPVITPPAKTPAAKSGWGDTPMKEPDWMKGSDPTWGGKANTPKSGWGDTPMKEPDWMKGSDPTWGGKANTPKSGWGDKPMKEPDWMKGSDPTWGGMANKNSSWDGYKEPDMAKGKSSWDGMATNNSTWGDKPMKEPEWMKGSDPTWGQKSTATPENPWGDYQEPEWAKGPAMWDTKAKKKSSSKKESVTEGSHGMATKLLQSIVSGDSSRAEGTKMSKELAQHYIDWIRTSPFGKKNGNLPLDMLVKASFNWGIERGLDPKLKGELSKLKSTIKESVNEAKYREAKDDWGVRLVQAINNNVKGLHTSVIREKRDVKEVIEAFGTMLKNAIKETLKHKYKPHPKAKDADDKIKTFISELKKFENIVDMVIAKPTKIGVTKLDDAWRSIWNHKYAAEIALAGNVFDSIIEGVSPKEMDAIKSAVQSASSFMGIGSELKKLGMKYTFATEPLPIYIIQPTPNNKVAIVNKKYASKPDFVHGDIAVGVMESKTGKSVNEGRAFINAARKAKTEGLTEFEFNGKKYPVTIKD